MLLLYYECLSVVQSIDSWLSYAESSSLRKRHYNPQVMEELEDLLRDVRNDHEARVNPIIRGRSHDNPDSAGRLSLPWAVVSFVPAAAKRRSAEQASTKPMLAARPLMAAMTGLVKPK